MGPKGVIIPHVSTNKVIKELSVYISKEKYVIEVMNSEPQLRSTKGFYKVTKAHLAATARNTPEPLLFLGSFTWVTQHMGPTT